jgi:hypothetical protein
MILMKSRVWPEEVYVRLLEFEWSTRLSFVNSYKNCGSAQYIESCRLEVLKHKEFYWIERISRILKPWYDLRHRT